MAKEVDEVSKYVRAISVYARNKFKNMSVDELDQNISQTRHSIAYLQAKDPENKGLSGLRDVLVMLEMARGRGEVM